MAVKLDLERVREEDTYDKKKVESLSSEIVLHQKKNQQLARNFDTAQNEVLRNYLQFWCLLLLPPPLSPLLSLVPSQLIQLKEASAEARTSFSQNITILRTTFKEEKQSWTIENDTSQQEQSVAK